MNSMSQTASPPSASRDTLRTVAIVATVVALLGISLPFTWGTATEPEGEAITAPFVEPVAAHDAVQTTAATDAACVADAKPAKDFTLPTLDGKQLSLSAHKGKVVLLNFWATWCAPCLAEIPDFVKVYNEQNLGESIPVVLMHLADRVPLVDVRFFVSAVLMQRETGGNLGEVLDNLASVIRDRFRVKRQIRVLTAHGRITGWILAGMPPALAAAMMMTTPSHLRMMINDPLGVQMIVGALVLQVIGTLIIRKLVNIPY